MMRHCCGSNDHPDSALFIQMYRLVSTYSLIKPPKGSNVEGAEMVQVLLNIKDIKNEEQRRTEWEAQLDAILEKGRNCSVLSDAAQILQDHDYFKCTTSEYVVAYISGFVVRKSQRFIKFKQGNETITCQKCLSTLQFEKNSEHPEFFKLIDLKSKGYLFYPSVKLFEFISVLERATLEVVDDTTINSNTLFDITRALEKLTPLPVVGCENHQNHLTHNILRFYLTTRMFFIAKQSNKNDSIAKQKTQANRKLAKLTTTTAGNKEVSVSAYKNDDLCKTKVAKKRKNEKNIDETSEPVTKYARICKPKVSTKRKSEIKDDKEIKKVKKNVQKPAKQKSQNKKKNDSCK